MTVDPMDFTSALSQNKEKLLGVGPEDLKSVMSYYNVTQDDVDDMVKGIREWLTKQPHLPGDKLNDRLILSNLVVRGFRVETVKISLDNYCYATLRMPEIVCNNDPLDPKIAECTKRGYWCIMPKKTPKNHRVIYFRMLPYRDSSVLTLVKTAFMFTEYRMWNDMAVGDCWLFDCEHVGIHETLQLTPALISNIVFYVTGCFGAHLKSIHLFNAPPVAMAVINAFKVLMKPKLGERIFVTTKEHIMKLFPKECLPADYGGEGVSFQEFTEEWCKTIQSNAWRQYFVEKDKICSDESKRLIPSHADEIFGANGYFRKLNID